MAFRIIKIIATTPGKRGTLVFAEGLAVVTGLYWGIEKNPVADMLAGHNKLKKRPTTGPRWWSWATTPR